MFFAVQGDVVNVSACVGDGIVGLHKGESMCNTNTLEVNNVIIVKFTVAMA